MTVTRSFLQAGVNEYDAAGLTTFNIYTSVSPPHHRKPGGGIKRFNLIS